MLVNLFWASCAILGVGIVFAAFPWLAFAVKVAGAAYLLWFGGRLIFKASRGKHEQAVQAAN
ncbi:LysE family transporter, partial [Mesorhizobium sp. M00.F.Ca.ET.216.01.1.1]|uniref:LysE family transporter n=1 Tax=Mesorhizobium sp. M00.F.Ca.ET.216.01.1.1 TaxID=2500528 RepID=UPI0032AEDE26